MGQRLRSLNLRRRCRRWQVGARAVQAVHCRGVQGSGWAQAVLPLPPMLQHGACRGCLRALLLLFCNLPSLVHAPCPVLFEVELCRRVVEPPYGMAAKSCIYALHKGESEKERVTENGRVWAFGRGRVWAFGKGGGGESAGGLGGRGEAVIFASECLRISQRMLLTQDKIS